jgi:hypothetical protein
MLALFQVPATVAVITVLPPANGVIAKAVAKGNVALVPMKFKVPLNVPVTVTATAIRLLLGRGRTTQPAVLTNVQPVLTAVIVPVETCWVGFCAKMVGAARSKIGRIKESTAALKLFIMLQN